MPILLRRLSSAVVTIYMSKTGFSAQPLLDQRALLHRGLEKAWGLG
jgi:hypothetical protein